MEIFSKLTSRFYPRQRNAPTYIAVRDRVDGAGAQIHGIMSAILFARAFGFIYLHRPFGHIDHGDDDPHYAKAWEDFMGLGRGEVRATEVDRSSLTVRDVEKIHRVRSRRNTLYTVPHCHKFGDWRPELYATFRSVFRDKYYASEKPPQMPNDGRLRVAVHVRRGDVSEVLQTSDRYASNEDMARILSSVTASLEESNLPHRVEIHSQGLHEDFEGLPVARENMFLDDDPRRTFHALVTADVLVMSKSSFSYAAAVMNTGAVIYVPFWHAPLPNWIPVDENLAVDANRLGEATRKVPSQ
ncbi:MAG: hypothetical protein GY791_07005 [Alphaproteobacteria bacterium]|nr:hypothetical protein [Alphaproteobacteria bacterium]